MKSPMLRIVNSAASDGARADTPADDAGQWPPSGSGPAPLMQVFGPFALDHHAQQLRRDGRPVALRPRAYAVLVQLLSRPGALVSKEALLDATWGHRHVSDSVLKVAINAVRQALGDDSAAPRYIETVARRGYRFVATVQAVAAAEPSAGPPEVHAERDQRDQDGAARAPLPLPTPAFRGNLPAPQPGLLGRDAELATLRAWLRTHRLVTLVGPAGVGKTRLALAAAAVDAPADGVWLVRLDALADAGPLVETVARTLQLSSRAGSSSLALAQALAPLQARLVIDNAEHLVDAVAAEVACWLAHAPRLQVLATSQQRLQVASEQVLPLGPLPVPDTPPGARSADMTPDEAAASWQDHAACALFVAHVRLQQPGFAPDAAMAADIVALCRLLDGLPLALELAAARVPALGTAGVRARMADRFSLLNRGARDAPARHRTLRAALEWSAELLSAEERRVLCHAAVFAGGFTPELAVAVIGEAGQGEWPVLDRLDDLRERSLLVAEGDGARRRWRMLDSIRAWALQQLEATGELQPVRQRHAEAMCRWMAAADAQHLFVPLIHWLQPLRLECDNLRAALEYALAQAAMPTANPSDAAALLVELHFHSATFMSRAGLRLEAAHWHRAVQPHVDMAAAARGRADGTEALRLENRLAMAAAALSVFGLHLKPADVWPALGAAQAAFEAQGRCEEAYMGLFLQSHLAMRLQRSGELGRLHERMRRLIRPDWNGRARSFAAWIGAIAHRARGEHRAYADFCIAERARAQQDDDPSGAWLAVYGLAQAQWALGERDAAIAMLDQTLAELHAADLLRENWHFAALAASLRLGRDASGETVRIARMAADLARADGLLWTLGDALALLAARQKRWDVAQGVRAWVDVQLSTRGERRGEPSGSLCRQFDELRREAGERGVLRSALSLVTDADVLAAVFGRSDPPEPRAPERP